MVTPLDFNETKRCARCILPETVPNVFFDTEGVCNCCRDFENKPDTFSYDFKANQEQFFQRVKDAKEYAIRNNSQYDVLVPLSGGRDSSYVAWKLATEYQMRVLCVNYANPYTAPQAKKNIDNLISKIGAKLTTFNYPHRIHERTLEANLKAWLKKPDLGALALICLACKPIYYEIFQIARKNKISLICDGSNIFEVTTFKTEALGAKDGGKLLTFGNIGRFVSKITENLRYIRPCNFSPAIKTVLSLHGKSQYLKWRYPEINKHGLFYIFPYNENEITNTLHQIGWKKAEESKSPWRMDCEIDMLKNYIYEKTINASQVDDLFSKNIRNGLMSRQEAIQRLEEAEINLDVVDRILSGIGLTRLDLDKACVVLKRQLRDKADRKAQQN